MKLAPVGSTGRLVQYSLASFFLYLLYGLGVKYFQGAKMDGFPGFTDIEFLFFSTIGSAICCLSIIFAAGWWRFRWTLREILPMVLSGTCTTLVIPAATLLYLLPVSIMVAMVIMRGSIIVITRLLDLVFGNQSRVSWPENVAAAFALASVSFYLFFARHSDFDFLQSRAALSILGIYILGYGARLYLMNYFKFSHHFRSSLTNQNFFAVEQLTVAFWIFVAFLFIHLPGNNSGLAELSRLTDEPPPLWPWAVVAGFPFGISACFTAFLFMFEGRTSTFSGLASRTSTLLAGTISTLLFALLFGGKWPKATDWISLLLVLTAVYFLALGEIRSKSRGAAGSP